MSAREKQFDPAVRVTAGGARAIRTPQCPEPEELLGWVEQGAAYPQAARLLDHLFTCAYCRHERALLREAHHLALTARIEQENLAALPETIGARTREVIMQGIAAPVKSVRSVLSRIESSIDASLQRIQRQPLLSMRGTGADAVPAGLRPAFTALRSRQPMLRWSPVESAGEYRVEIFVMGQTSPRPVLNERVGTQTEWRVPDPMQLEPGSLYRWRVRCEGDSESGVSSPVGFAVLSEAMQEEVAALEQQTGASSLARIGLYEAYGLYEEAFQQAALLLDADQNDSVARAAAARLRQKMRLSDE